MSFEARCHCGAVAVNVEGDVPAKAIECNCSHCRIKGLVLGAVPGDAVSVPRGEDALQTYQFNRRAIEHLFCGTCGTQPFSRGKGPDGRSMAMINLRCVPGVDLDALETIRFDGASL